MKEGLWIVALLVPTWVAGLILAWRAGLRTRGLLCLAGLSTITAIAVITLVLCAMKWLVDYERIQTGQDIIMLAIAAAGLSALIVIFSSIVKQSQVDANVCKPLLLLFRLGETADIRD